jgi:hypothetical protein
MCDYSLEHFASPTPYPAVRVTSALPMKFPGVFSTMRHEKPNKRASLERAPSSPKAKVRGSNPLGRATKIKCLAEFSWVRVSAK